MEWFNGGVGEAIAAAKAKKAIFAVFVKGNKKSSIYTLCSSKKSN